jgi:hypothetical protein
MAEVPTKNEIIEASIDRRLEGVHTATPGVIVSYSSANCTATVQPSLPGVEAHKDVPICIPGAWAAGDPVLLVYCEREFDDALADAADERRHGLGSPIAVPLIARPGQSVDFVALAGLVITRLEAMQSAIDSHTHTSAAAGSPTTTPVPPIIWPTSGVAATKLKAR